MMSAAMSAWGVLRIGGSSNRGGGEGVELVTTWLLCCSKDEC